MTGLLLFLYFLPNALYSLELYGKIDPLPYVTGRETYEEYVQARRPEYAAIARANEVVAGDRKVLGLFLGHRRYYFSASAIVVNEVFTSIAGEARSGGAIAERLLQLGYSHLVVRTDLFQQWLEGTDPQIRARVVNFTAHRLRELVIEKGYGLYEIVDPEPRGAAAQLRPGTPNCDANHLFSGRKTPYLAVSGGDNETTTHTAGPVTGTVIARAC